MAHFVLHITGGFHSKERERERESPEKGRGRYVWRDPRWGDRGGRGRHDGADGRSLVCDRSPDMLEGTVVDFITRCQVQVLHS